MEIKTSILGILIYAAIVSYTLALLADILGLFPYFGSRLKKTAQLFFAAGFCFALSAYVWRWYDSRHIPMQNLFDIFLCLGVIIYPLSIVCLKLLRIGLSTIDMFLGIIILFPIGFVFPEQTQQPPPALQSPLFIPHVGILVLAYIFMAKAAGQALLHLAGYRQANSKLLSPEPATYKLICAGFPLLTFGLIIGSFWAQMAWGSWWSWDPKESWTLAALLVYAIYLYFRSLFADRFSRLNSLLALAGFAFILITLLWANLSKLFPGLHNYAR